MKALTHSVVDMTGKEVGSIDLDPAVFGIEINQGLVHQVARWQRAKKRSGTHATLNRSKMEGGAKKPFKQKGTGRARAGTSRSPLWVGGAVIHGPQPRSYEFAIPKKQRRKALASVLTDKCLSNNLVIVDKLEVSSGKTKDMSAVLNSMGVSAKACILVSQDADEDKSGVWLSSRNLPKVKTLQVEAANVYDLVNGAVLVIAKDAVETLQKKVSGALTQVKQPEAAADK